MSDHSSDHILYRYVSLFLLMRQVHVIDYLMKWGPTFLGNFDVVGTVWGYLSSTELIFRQFHGIVLSYCKL